MLFTILPISINDPSLYTIPESEVEILGSKGVETSAYAHWKFGGGAGSLVDLVNSKVLTPVGSDPTFSQSYMTMSADYGQALKTDRFEQATNDSYTIAMAFKTAADTGGVLIPEGTLSNTTGTSLFISSSNVYLTARGALSSINIGEPVPVDTWKIAVMSIGYTSSSFSVKIKIGDTYYEGTAASYTPETTLPISLGSVAYANSANINIDVAEFVLFDNAFDQQGVFDVYTRMKDRLAEKSIIV